MVILWYSLKVLWNNMVYENRDSTFCEETYITLIQGKFKT